MRRINHLLPGILLLLFTKIQAQDVGGSTLVSQARTTIANIGKCEMTIKYHSPLVRGRKIFGGIVPYNFVVDGREYPWRAGSNQRTTITFSHDVTIEGQSLPAGNYGFVVLVNESEWTLIFSSGQTWGAFNYDPANDVLRVPVTPEETGFQEWLSYEFVDPGTETVGIALRWENLRVVFHVATDAVANSILDLTAKEKPSAADLQALAIRTLDADPSQQALAMDYLEQSLPLIDAYEEDYYREAYTFNYKVLKGELLLAMGQLQAGDDLIKEALAAASGFSTYYYALNMLLVKNKPEEALRLLRQQVKRDPENRANFLALGEYYLHRGDQQQATESFKKAYELSIDSPGENYARYLYLQNKIMLEIRG